MKLVHPALESQMVLVENEVIVLTIENSSCFCSVLQELSSQINGFDGRFILSDEDDILEISKYVDLCINPFALECNQKRFLSKLYTESKEFMMNHEFLLTSELHSQICRYMETVEDMHMFPVQYNHEFDLLNFFKFIELKFDTNCENLLERVTTYIALLGEFSSIKCFVLVNMKSYFSEAELEELYKCAFYNKIHLLLLESVFRKSALQCEKDQLIDADLCEIL